MKIHEYQAKDILRQFSIPVLKGIDVDTPSQAWQAAEKIGGNLFAVKAQIHAGGRGKGGGIKIARTADAVQQYTSALLGHKLITPQTTKIGQEVKKVYIEQGCDIVQELYLSLLLDRDQGCLVLITSTAGGMDIEEVAHQQPNSIHKHFIDCQLGLHPFQARQVAFGLGVAGQSALKLAAVIENIYKAYCATDAALIEINPLVITKQGDPVALDAKMTFDDNALYRHPKIVSLRDPDEEDPAEYAAQQHDLNYVKLQGDIGCMVNGAGLAMATMDVIKLQGGEPANFLDVGGGATQERVTQAFKIILSDPNVKGILVNIFGGIMRCDIIAAGIIAAIQETSLTVPSTVPLVVRLAGTHSEQGQKMLEESGLAIITAHELGEAAQKIVQATRGGRP